MPNNVQRYGFKTIHDRMDEHVAREDARPNPRRANTARRDDKGKFKKSQHRNITQGARVERNAIVFYPYGGKPGETITKPGGFRAREAWKRSIHENIDQIGKRVAREASMARPGCALLTVRANQATALAYKIRAALKGGQVRDARGPASGSRLYLTRTEGVLFALDYAAKTGQTIRIGVYTRNELKTVASQRTNAKHYTNAVRNLERALKGK